MHRGLLLLSLALFALRGQFRPLVRGLMPAKTHTKLWQQEQWRSDESTWHDYEQNLDWPGEPFSRSCFPTALRSLVMHVRHGTSFDCLIYTMQNYSPLRARRMRDAVVVRGPKTNQFKEPVTSTTTSGIVPHGSFASDKMLYGGCVAAVRAARPTWHLKYTGNSRFCKVRNSRIGRA